MRGAWLLLFAGLTGLLALRASYALTCEPAPSVRVRWRDGTTDARRAQLERMYRLVTPAAPQGLSYSYALVDTSRRNIRALVTGADVADTGDIDRRAFAVPWATEHESTSRMWIADRIPGLRQPRVRWTLVAALAAMTLSGLWRVIRGVDWSRMKEPLQHG